MTRLQILQDFFQRWPAVSLSKFASDVNLHRNTLNRNLQEQKEPGDAAWPKIATGLSKYGYPTSQLKGHKVAIATVGGYRKIEELFKNRDCLSTELFYNFLNIPIWKPDQPMGPQRPLVIGWENGPPAFEDQLLKMLIEQLEIDLADCHEEDILVTADLEVGSGFDGKVVYLKPK